MLVDTNHPWEFSDLAGRQSAKSRGLANRLASVIRPSWVSISGVFAAVSLAMGTLLGGCIPSAKTAFDSPAPSKRLDAIVDAAAKNDRSSTAQLVEMLKSEDPAERMLAIRTLERITQQTHGYRHQDPEWKRLQAINRWEAWLESEDGSPEETARTPGTESRGELASTREEPERD